MPLTELQIKKEKPEPGSPESLYGTSTRAHPTSKSLKQAEDGGI
jgi:hypothetical protein